MLRRYRLSVQINAKQEVEFSLGRKVNQLSEFLRKEERVWIEGRAALREAIFRDLCFLMKMNSFGYSLVVTIIDADCYCHLTRVTLEQALARGLLLSTERLDPSRCRVPGARETPALYLLQLEDIYRVSRKTRLLEGLLESLPWRRQGMWHSAEQYMAKFLAEVVDPILA